MKRLSMLVVVAAVAAACTTTDDPGRLPRPAEPATVTVSAERRAPALETYPAVIESEQTAEIATRMSGTVTGIAVDVGAHVSAGDTLFTIDGTDVTARVSAARAQLELADRAFGRIDRLAADGAASQQELDQARASREAARAGLAEATAQEAYAVVRSPFDGVVTARSVDAGDLAVPGIPLLTVMSPAALQVVADLPAHRSGEITVGAEVGVTVAGVPRLLVARVTRVVPALGSGSRTFRVEASPVDDWTGAVPGSYARLAIAERSEGPRWLPADAIVERGQLTGVYTVDADTLWLRWVRLGRTRGDAVELLSGPASALTVVRAPAEGLYDGMPVANAQSADWTVAALTGTSTTTNPELDR